MSFRAVPLDDVSVLRLLLEVEQGAGLPVPDPFGVKLDANRDHICCKLINEDEPIYLDLSEYIDLDLEGHLGAIYRAREEFFTLVVYLAGDDDLIAYRLDNPCLNPIAHLVSADPGEELPPNWWTIKVIDPN